MFIFCYIGINICTKLKVEENKENIYKCRYVMSDKPNNFLTAVFKEFMAICMKFPLFLFNHIFCK